MRTLKNLWDFKYKYHVVTAREVLGLLHFGYTMKPGPASLWFVCTDPAQAKTATVQEYGSFMQSHEAAGPDSIRSILVMDPKLKKEIEGFDKAKLRH